VWGEAQPLAYKYVHLLSLNLIEQPQSISIMVKDVAARAYGGASMMKVADAESGMVYRGLELLYLTITLRVARSFTDKQKGSNSIEQELSVVKRRTERRL
jgi:hypothetical protein